MTSIRFSAHFPSRSSACATSQLGKNLAAGEVDARPLDRDRAAVEGELSFGPPPAVARTSLGAAVARPAQALGVLRHHAGERGDPRRQAEALETRPHILPSPFYQRRSGAGGVIFLFMALPFFVE